MKNRSRSAADHFAVIDTTALASAVVTVADAPADSRAAGRPEAAYAFARTAAPSRRSPSAPSPAGPLLRWWRRAVRLVTGRRDAR